jgi:hypothetical protein
MKKILIPVLILFSAQLFAQSGASFFARLPSVPKNTCLVDTVEVKEYKKHLDDVIEELAPLVSQKKKKLQTEMDLIKPKIEKKVAQDHGLSDSDVQKLKSKKMSEAEKKALMEKMLQEKTQISMGEIEQLKKMKKDGNKEGIQNWADAYSTQKMAEMTSGDSTKTPEQIEMEKNLDKNSKLNDLVKEQKILVDRIDGVNKSYTNKLMEFNKIDSIETVKLKKHLAPLEKRLTEYPTSQEREQIFQEMAIHYLAYCEEISPRYMDFVRDTKARFEPLLPEFNRLEILNNEISKLTLGLDEYPESPGLMQLEAVMGIAKIISGAYGYALIRPSKEFLEISR